MNYKNFVHKVPTQQHFLIICCDLRLTSVGICARYGTLAFQTRFCHKHQLHLWHFWLNVLLWTEVISEGLNYGRIMAEFLVWSFFVWIKWTIFVIYALICLFVCVFGDRSEDSIFNFWIPGLYCCGVSCNSFLLFRVH